MVATVRKEVPEMLCGGEQAGIGRGGAAVVGKRLQHAQSRVHSAHLSPVRPTPRRETVLDRERGMNEAV
jgi:hypothetical protein